jgi:hypothetical protein
LSVDEAKASRFAVYPNPAKNNVVVSSKTATISKIEIYNLLGQSVMDKTYSENLTEKINVSNLQPGMYILKINSDTTKQLLIE